MNTKKCVMFFKQRLSILIRRESSKWMNFVLPGVYNETIILDRPVKKPGFKNEIVIL